jgi:hypothetical protein
VYFIIGLLLLRGVDMRRGADAARAARPAS